MNSESLPLPTLLLIVGAAVALIFVLFFILRKKKPSALPEEEEKALPLPQTPELRRAEAQLEAARRERAAAEARIEEEQAARARKEEEAKQKAQSESQALSEAQARLEALREEAASAQTEEARRAARDEIARLEAEASRRRKEAQEASRRAEYEAKKAQDAQARAERKEAEEQRRFEELEAARAKAEAAAAEERARLRKIEAESGRTLSEGLARTRGGFMARLSQLVGASTALDDRFMGELEEILFTADIGPRTAQRLMEVVQEKLKKKELTNPEKVRLALKAEIESILTLGGRYTEGGMPAHGGKPQVVMIVGVNGSGKTTTLGKLAFKERVSGRSVLLGAGDTFRAAAAEQLDVWAERAEVPVIKAPADTDPASVCFDAVKTGVDEDKDLVLLDTAGRLHTATNLMEELKKVKRVAGKALEGAPHETWLVVDGTTGQNGLMQARLFHEALGLTGVVLTKLDGTAKGGVVIGICDELKVPVRYIGVGEKIGDLRPFSPQEFVQALFEGPSAG